MKPITEDQAKAIESQSHIEIQSLLYDTGGSLADLFEDKLAAALRKLEETD